MTRKGKGNKEKFSIPDIIQLDRGKAKKTQRRR